MATTLSDADKRWLTETIRAVIVEDFLPAVERRVIDKAEQAAADAAQHRTQEMLAARVGSMVRHELSQLVGREFRVLIEGANDAAG